MKGIEQFAIGVVSICVIVMRGVGVIDNLFSDMMNAMGVFDPTWQLCILLCLIAFYVVLSLRAVGGMLGWAMMFFAVLLLLHRTVPSLSAPDFPIASQLNNALK
jgi:hypothetical protein